MAEGSGLSSQINYPAIPIIEGAGEYLSKRIVPDATYRNWNSYSNKISFEKGVNVMEAFSILPDPQTNGGLLIAVDPGSVDEVKELFRKNGLEKFANPVGRFVGKDEKVIHVLK
jgi:selenide,water dikinase